MSTTLDLPPDLSADELDLLQARRRSAIAETDARTAVEIAVLRAWKSLRRRMGARAALDWIDGDPGIPATRSTARDIVYRDGAYRGGDGVI